MSQIDFIRDTVSDFFDALIGSNLADAAFYLPVGGGDAIPCRILLKRQLQPIGTFGKVGGEKKTLRIVNADLPLGQDRGSDIRIESIAKGTEFFTLVEKLDDDGALTTWAVEHHYV